MFWMAIRMMAKSLTCRIAAENNFIRWQTPYRTLAPSEKLIRVWDNESDRR